MTLRFWNISNFLKLRTVRRNKYFLANICKIYLTLQWFLKKLHSKCQWNVQILTKYSSIWFNTYLYLTCFQHHKLETKTQHSIDYNLRNSLRWYFVVWYRISRYMYGYSSLNIKAIHVWATFNIVYMTIFLSYLPFGISQSVKWTNHIELNL